MGLSAPAVMIIDRHLTQDPDEHAGTSLAAEYKAACPETKVALFSGSDTKPPTVSRETISFSLDGHFRKGSFDKVMEFIEKNLPAPA